MMAGIYYFDNIFNIVKYEKREIGMTVLHVKVLSVG